MNEISLHLVSPWAEFLSDIDANLSVSTEVTCIGGFVLANIYNAPRYTGDLDLIEVRGESPQELEQLAGRGSLLHRKHSLYVQYVGGIVTMPIDFEQRLTRLKAGLRRLDIFVPDIYDLVLSKLERNSPKDLEDIEFLAQKQKLTFSLLLERFDAELDFLPNRDRHITTLNFWRDWFQD